MSGHSFVRPGQVGAELPPPDACVRCGQPAAAHGGPEWRDRPMPTIGELALYLGGSDTSFTGDLLRLMSRADPANRAKLADVYPRESRALKAWAHDFARVPTMGELEDWLWEPTP